MIFMDVLLLRFLSFWFALLFVVRLVSGPHPFEVFLGWASSELLIIQRLKRIDLGADGVFIDHQRLDVLPPLVVSSAEFFHDLWVVADDVCFLTRISRQIVKLFVVEEPQSPMG